MSSRLRGSATASPIRRSGFGEPVISEALARLGQCLGGAAALRYLYDFVDDWEHKITVEKVLPADTCLYPLYLGGANACPPEDVGAGLTDTMRSSRGSPTPRTPSMNTCSTGTAGDLIPPRSTTTSFRPAFSASSSGRQDDLLWTVTSHNSWSLHKTRGGSRRSERKFQRLASNRNWCWVSVPNTST